MCQYVKEKFFQYNLYKVEAVCKYTVKYSRTDTQRKKQTNVTSCVRRRNENFEIRNDAATKNDEF